MLAAVTRPASVAFSVVALGAGLLWIGPRFGSLATPARDAVPQTLGPWLGKAIAVDRRVFEILETSDVAIMEYRMGDSAEPPVWLAQVNGFGKRAAFHPPELCYVGSHFEVLERGPLSVLISGQQKRVMRLVVSQGEARFEAWYWFTANGRVTPNYYQQQWWLVLDAIRRKPMTGTLVRISTPLNDSAASHRRLLAFVTSLDAATLPRAARREPAARGVSSQAGGEPGTQFSSVSRAGR